MSVNRNIDKFTSIGFITRLCHTGEYYVASRIFTAVANGSSADIVITTGNKYAHFSMLGKIGGDGRFFLYEAPNITGGTALSLQNVNRTLANNNTSSLVYSPTVNSVGTQIHSTIIPGGSGRARARIGGTDSSLIRDGAEIILKLNSTYLLRVTNVSGGAEDISLSVGLYETEKLTLEF